MLARIRAALTPQLLIVLAGALLLIALSASGGTQRATSNLEERIAKTLSAIEGAGKVQVVIVTRETAETASAAFVSSSQRTQEVPTGAVAVAQGADDPLVRMELTQALCSLLNLPASCVSVMTGGD